MLVRPFRNGDAELCTPFLRDAGLLPRGIDEQEFVQRAGQASAVTLVAEEVPGVPAATISGFLRSPSDLWGAQLAISSLAVRRGILVAEIWNGLVEFARKRGLCSITTTTRVGDSRTSKIYKTLMGFTETSQQRLISYLPLCRNVWNDIGDVGLFRPRVISKGDGQIRYDGRNIALYINESEQIYEACRQDNGEVITRQTFGPRFSRGNIIRLGIGWHVNLTRGYIQLDAGIKLFPPWVSDYSLDGFEIPAYEEWDCTVTEDTPSECSVKYKIDDGHTAVFRLCKTQRGYRVVLNTNANYSRISL
jgi:hypothetical protein